MKFKAAFIGILLSSVFANFSSAQTVQKTIAGPSDNPPYAAIRPYWIDKPVIEVIGRSNVQFDPNIASMNFTIQEINEDADKGLILLNKRSKPAFEKVKELIGENGKISISYSRSAIYEQYRDKEGNKKNNTRDDKVENYVLAYRIYVSTDKIENIPIIKAEIMAIGNTIQEGNTDFQFLPSTEQSRLVFKAAVVDAKERAKDIAELHGKNIKLLVINEGASQCLSSPTVITGFQRDDYGSTKQALAIKRNSNSFVANSKVEYDSQKYETVLQASDLILPFAPQKVSLTAQVCMVYAIE